MSVNFKNAVPTDMVIRQPVSTSKSVLRKNLMELLPNDNSVHSSGGNEIIRFTIASNSDFWSGKESYFRFRVRRTLPAADTAQNGLASLDVGGLHSVFKSIEIRSLSTGTLIQRCDHYNRYFAMKTLIHQSPEEVHYMGSQYGDSMDYEKTSDPYKEGSWKAVSYTALGSSLTSLGALTVADGRFLSEVAAGDNLKIQIAAGMAAVARVTSVTTDNVLLLDSGINIASPNILSIFIQKRHEITPARVWSVETRADSGTAGAASDKIVEFRPFASFLNQNIPLFLMRGGVEIVFEMDQAHRFINTGLDVEDCGTGTLTGFQLSQPRLMAMMTTPHPDIVNRYVTQWKTDGGIIFNIPSVKTRRVTGQTGDTNANFQTQFGVRSARKIYTILQDQTMAETNSALCQASNSISTCVRGGVTKFQYKVGSHNYPNRAVEAPVGLGARSTEALEHLRLVSGSKTFRFSPQDWYSVNTIKTAADASVTNESLFFVMCADLSRDNGPNSNLTGADTSVVPVDLEIERSAGSSWAVQGYPGVPVYYNFVEHDAYLKLSSAQLSVMS